MTTGDALNDEQRQALTALDAGSVMVVAGPGSGKTHTLVSAIESVLMHDRSGAVLCLTFTTKAAENLRTRLGSHDKGFVGTFHALAVRLLNTAEKKLPIISNEESFMVLAELKRRHQSSASNLRELALIISRYKNGSLDTPEAQRLAKEYDAELTKRGLIDYDDLILRAIQQAGALKPYSYIFVDEFQDTSPRQYDLLQQLSDAETKWFAIGDPKQSIYRFRGADGSVFQRLQADCSPQLIHLQRNYRSTEPIVAAANRVFPDQLPQQPMRSGAGLAHSIETLDEYSEPAYILRTIEHALGGTEWHRTHHDQTRLEAAHFRDFAILYRTRRQGELIAKKLRAAGLPLQCLGEDSPYASPLVQLLRTICAHTSAPDAKTLEAVERATERAKLGVDPSTLDMIDRSETPSATIKALASRLDIAEHDSVLQFENLASRFKDLKEFLRYLDELSDQAFFDPRADAVVLSTIHASKGLEFRHVFVAGCNEGLLPSSRATAPEAVDEEKRLFYVALTRARDSLILLHTRQYGKQAAPPSPFLNLLSLPSGVDEGLPAIERQRQRTRQKRAQQRLL